MTRERSSREVLGGYAVNPHGADLHALPPIELDHLAAGLTHEVAHPQTGDETDAALRERLDRSQVGVVVVVVGERHEVDRRQIGQRDTRRDEPLRSGEGERARPIGEHRVREKAHRPYGRASSNGRSRSCSGSRAWRRGRSGRAARRPPVRRSRSMPSARKTEPSPAVPAKVAVAGVREDVAVARRPRRRMCGWNSCTQSRGQRGMREQGGGRGSPRRPPLCQPARERQSGRCTQQMANRENRCAACLRGFLRSGTGAISHRRFCFGGSAAPFGLPPTAPSLDACLAMRPGSDPERRAPASDLDRLRHLLKDRRQGFLVDIESHRRATPCHGPASLHCGSVLESQFTQPRA